MAGLVSPQPAAATTVPAASPSAPSTAPRSVSARALVPVLARMKLVLWRRSYRKNIGKIIGTAFGALYGLGALVGFVFLLLGTTLWSGEGETFPQIMRGLGALVVLLWLLIPVLAFGIDDTPDARLFALFPHRARTLQPGLFAAALVSLPAVFTLLALLIATAFEAIWLFAFGHGLVQVATALIALLPANVAGFALCVLLPRAWFAHSASRVSSRRGREYGGVLALILMLGVIYGGSLALQGLGESIEIDLSWLRTAVDIAAWTPFGALFAVPMDLAEGHVLVALARAVIGGAALAAVWIWWRRSLDRALTSALSGSASSGTTKVTALVPRGVKASPFGASFGRALKYWRRDTRYYAAVGVVPLVLLFMVALGLVQPESKPMGLTMTVIMLGALAITTSNEIGFDGPAGWVNIVAGIPARANLLGRIAAVAVISLPLLLAFTVIVPIAYGMPGLIPLMLGGSFGMMLTGWGASLVIGTLLPYPTSPPGTNPMKDRSSSSTNAMLAVGAGLGAVVVPQLPAIGVAVWGVVVGSLVLQLVAVAIAIAVGAVCLWLGALIGTRRLEAHYIDVFQKVRDFL